MKTFNFFGTLCLLTGLCFVSALADENKPAEFYEDNFAETPLNKDHSVSTAGGKGSTSAGKELKGEKSTLKKGSKSPLVAKGVSSASLAGFEVQPVISVGAILNAFDQDHLVTYSNKYMEMLLDRDLQAGNVYLRDMLARGEKMEFKYDIYLTVPILGGMTQVVRDLPEKYAKVSVSPTWIIRTEKGEYLLEGIENPEQFITADGGFVEKPVAAPALEETRPTPVPLKPASF